MAGQTGVIKETEQEVPPNAAGREVLNYVNQQEKEADEAFKEAQGIAPEEDGDNKNEQEAEKKAEDEEQGKPDGKEVKDKEPEHKDKVAEDDKPGDLTTGLNTENAEKRIRASQKQMHDSNKRAVSAEGERDRLKEENEALQRKIYSMPETPAAKEPSVEIKEAEPAKADDDDLAKSLAELEQEYPEIAKPMLKMMARQDADNKALKNQVSELQESEKTRIADVKTAKTNDHLSAIADVHSDYEEISKEPLLDEWINSLPPIERAGAKAIKTNGSTAEVISLLTTFKQANGYELPADSKGDISENKGNSKLDKAKKATNPSFNKTKDVNLQDGQVVFTRKQIENMSPKEFADNESAIDLAMSKGLVR